MISVVFPDPNIFLCVPASAADAAAINPNGINTLLANEVITFFILMVILFLVRDQIIYLKILLTASFLIIEFLKI